MFEYDCPNCGEEMYGGFDSEVTCQSCNTTYPQKLELLDPEEGEYTAHIIAPRK